MQGVSWWHPPSPHPLPKPHCAILHLSPLLINLMCYFPTLMGLLWMFLWWDLSIYILYLDFCDFVCFNLCVHKHMWVYKCIHAYICVCISQRTISGINSQKLFILFFIFLNFFYDTKALIDLEPSDFDRISDQQTPSFNCLCLLRTGTASHHHQAWIFKVVPKNAYSTSTLAIELYPWPILVSF